MNKRFVSALYVLNIISQAIFTLLTPTAILFAIGWLFVSQLSAPGWIYAILIPIGVIFGFYHMIKFVISASESLERLEKQNKKRRGSGK